MNSQLLTPTIFGKSSFRSETDKFRNKFNKSFPFGIRLIKKSLVKKKICKIAPKRCCFENAVTEMEQINLAIKAINKSKILREVR